MINFIKKLFKRKQSVDFTVKYKGLYNINEIGHFEYTFLEEYANFDMYLRREKTNIKIDTMIGLKNKLTLNQIDNMKNNIDKYIDAYEKKYCKNAKHYSGIMFGQFYWNGNRLR